MSPAYPTLSRGVEEDVFNTIVTLIGQDKPRMEFHDWND